METWRKNQRNKKATSFIATKQLRATRSYTNLIAP
jgi:hypothetical protein